MQQPDQEVIPAHKAGDYREFTPAAALRPHFLCIWTHLDIGEARGPVAVFPDGCIDILWSEGRLMIAGPDTAPQIIDRGLTNIVGARFAPGAASRWLGVPVSELVNLRVDLEALWGSRAAMLVDRLAASATIGETSARLQKGLADLAGTVAPPDRAMAAAYRRFSHANGIVPINDLAAMLNVSERTLRRQFLDHFGYGPKTLERILRFQKFLRLGRQDPETGIGALAIDAHYADQAHLSREARCLSGLSPAALLQHLAA